MQNISVSKLILIVIVTKRQDMWNAFVIWNRTFRFNFSFGFIFALASRVLDWITTKMDALAENKCWLFCRFSSDMCKKYY